MYRTIFFLSLLGTSILLSSSERVKKKDPPVPSVSRSNENFVLVNPRQVQDLEKSLQHFLSRLAEPIKQPIILRQSSQRKDNVQRTIRQTCQSIRKKVNEFASAWGLSASVRRYERSANYSTLCEDWFSEVVLQGSNMLCDLCSISNEVWQSVDSYFNKSNITLPRAKQPQNQGGGFRFLGAINDVTEYSEKLSQCMLEIANKRRNKTSFDLNKVVLKMARGPPKDVLKTLRSIFDKTSSDISSKSFTSAKRLHIFVCLSIINNDVHHDECIRELEYLDECVNDLKEKSNNKLIDRYNSQSWLKSIQDLSNCEIQRGKNGQVYVSCNIRRGIPKRMNQKIKYIYERILNRQIPRQSPLHGTASALGDVLSRSTWGKRFINELCQYFAIYEEGQRKLNELSTVARKNKKAFARYRKISEALKTYKKGILLKTFTSVRKMHRAALDFERFLISGIKMALNETWNSHIKILSCMTEWMIKLLELYSGERMTDNNTELVASGTTLSSNINYPDDNSALYSDESLSHYHEKYRSRGSVSRSSQDIMKDVDASMKDLIASMNRVSRFRSNNARSTLASLANNLLLVAMFMETVTFVSTLYCFDQPGKSDANSLEMDDWRGRQKRSWLSMDLQNDAHSNLEKYSPLTIKIQENAAVHIDENKKWLVYKVFFERLDYEDSEGTNILNSGEYDMRVSSDE